MKENRMRKALKWRRGDVLKRKERYGVEVRFYCII